MSENAARDRVSFRFLATPQDTGWNGSTVDSGRILEWIDRAGYACAAAWSASYCVTAYVGNVNFSRSIPAASVIEVNARIIHTGRTSMQVLVRVESLSPESAGSSRAMDCILVFVAVDGGGRPTSVPNWRPQSVLEKQLEANARARGTVREQIHAAMRSQVYSDEGTTPRVTFRFLALPSAANFAGNAHGGTVMRWINEAAYACAAQWSSPTAHATYSGGIHFYRPIHIGHVVEVDSRIIHVQESGMHIATRVRSWAPSDPTSVQRTTQCLSIFNDTDEHGLRLLAQELTLTTHEDRRLNQHAQELTRLRAQIADLPKGPRAAAPLEQPS